MFDFDVVVIGGGSAGLAAATEAGAQGAKVALIERDRLGGAALWRREVPSRTLARSAKVWELVKRSEEFGVHVEKPRLIWNAVKLRLADVRDEIRQLQREELSQAKVQTILGHARFGDAHTLEVETKSGASQVSASKVIVAVGSTPIVPALEGLAETGFLLPETLFERPSLPKSLIFLGASPLGLELAQTFARFGTRVVLVSEDERLVPDAEPEVGELLERILRADGVEIHLGAKFKRVEGSESHKRLVFETSEGERSAEAGELVVTMGEEPRLNALRLELAGVNIDDNGIAVDEDGQTSTPSVGAVGSCATVPRRGVFSLATDPEIALVGSAKGAAKVERVEFKTLPDAHIEGETSGFALSFWSETGALLGAQVIGWRAGEFAANLSLGLVPHSLSAS